MTQGAAPKTMPGGLILGSARCGSTLVSDILRLHPDILSLSELFATAGPHAFRSKALSGTRFWRRLATPSRTLSQIGNPAVAPSEFLYGRVDAPAHDPFNCPPILAITLPHLSADPDALFARIGARVSALGTMPLADHYRALFSGLAEETGGRRVWVERSGGSLVAAGTLLDMFPEARPVLLVRDGADTALSMRDYPATRLAIWMWRHLSGLGVDLLGSRDHYGRGEIWPILSAIGGRIGLKRILEQRPRLADCGAFWSAVTMAGIRGMADAKPLVVHYETLCRDPRNQIASLGHYLTGSAPDDWLDRAEKRPASRPSRIGALDPQEQSVLRDACAPGEAALAAWLATKAD